MLLSYKFFWILTIAGFFIMCAGAVTIFLLENHHQAELQFIDYVVWVIGIVTTVGYGEIQIKTVMGKFIVSGLMLFGSLYLWSYMAFLVTALVEPEINKISKDVDLIEHDLETVKEQLDRK